MPIEEVRLAKSIVVVFFTSLIRWLLGCARIIIIAFIFGATSAYDAYLVAFTIPEMVTGLLTGVVAVTFIPIFTEYIVKEGDVKAWDFVSNLINIFFIIGLLLIFLMIIVAPFIVRIVSPGFNQNTFQLAVNLIIIIFPIILIITLSELMTQILHTYQRFVIPNLVRILEVAVVIFCIVFLSKKHGIFSLAWGILLGAFFRLILQVPLLWGKFRYYHFSCNFRLPGIKKINVIVGPLISCMIFLRIGILIERLLASTLKEGTISILGYATTLTQVPAELFLDSVAIIFFPLISKYASEGKIADFKLILSRGIRMGNFILIPIALLFIFFAKPIIKFLLERGQFTSLAAQDTSVALAIYSVGLFAMPIYFFSTHACYALQEIKATIKIAVFVTLLNIVLKLSLINYLSFAGLALATSITLIVQSGLLMRFIVKRIGSIEGRKIILSSLKILIASFFMILTCWLVLKFIPPHSHSFVQLIALVIGAGISYFVFSYLLRIQEVATVKALLKNMICSKV